MNTLECGPGNKNDNAIKVFDYNVLIPTVWL